MQHFQDVGYNHTVANATRIQKIHRMELAQGMVVWIEGRHKCQNEFFCTEALYCYCCVHGLGWPLAISWRFGFSGKGFHILNIVELRARAHFSKRQLLESHLHIADYGLASLDGFQHLPSRPACLVCHVGHVRGLGS